MPKDLRDPKLLGSRLLSEAYVMRSTSFADHTFSMCADDLDDILQYVPNYSANPTCIEKYGRPQDLPPTPF